MDEVYTRWDIISLPGGRAHIRMETNDDNDDGIPDVGPVTVWERDLMNKSLALRLAGQKSHRGAGGQKVTVYLDGKELA